MSYFLKTFSTLLTAFSVNFFASPNVFFALVRVFFGILFISFFASSFAIFVYFFTRLSSMHSSQVPLRSLPIPSNVSLTALRPVPPFFISDLIFPRVSAPFFGANKIPIAVPAIKPARRAFSALNILDEVNE